MHRDYGNTDDSRATLEGGRNGMVMGALAGGLAFAIGALILDMTMQISTGGPGVNFIAGAAAGGLAGMMIGALKARHGGHRGLHGYRGPERRLRPIAFEGPDRRVHH